MKEPHEKALRHGKVYALLCEKYRGEFHTERSWEDYLKSLGCTECMGHGNFDYLCPRSLANFSGDIRYIHIPKDIEDRVLVLGGFP